MSLSTFLNGRAPDRLRGLQFLALSDVGVLLTLSSVSDAGGGATSTWGTAGTVACRIDPLSGVSDSSGRTTGGRIDERSTHLVTTPAGTDVSVSSRFVIAGRGTFEVTAVGQVTAEFSHPFEVLQIS